MLKFPVNQKGELLAIPYHSFDTKQGSKHLYSSTFRLFAIKYNNFLFVLRVRLLNLWDL